jgi:hypothetical protein
LAYFGTLRPLGMNYKRGAQRAKPSSANNAPLDDAAGQALRSVVEDVVEAVSGSRDAEDRV